MVPSSHLSVLDWIHECAIGISASPARTILTSLGTVIGVAAVVTTLGLTESADGAVSSTFNSQLATQVSFQVVESGASTPTVSNAAVERLSRLPGVVNAGIVWQIDDGQPLSVDRVPLSDPSGPGSYQLPFMAASASALATMHASVKSGRLYDGGFSKRHEMVALLGSAAASELGINSATSGAAIFVGTTPLTIIGIIDQTTQQSQALLDVVVPPDEAAVFANGDDSPTVIVQTAPGAAQVVGQEGPAVLAPYSPSSISAEVPPSPQTLREKVQSSVSSLLVVLALLALTVGIVAIASTTLLSVMQRRSEIGLRRALGATPLHIGVLVLGEAAFIGAVGGLLGSSIGVLFTAGASIAKGWTPVMDWRVMIAAPLLGLLAGALAGVYPSLRATRVAPIAALRGP